MKFRFVDAATDELEEAIIYSRANFSLSDELNAAVKNAITIIMAHTLRFPKRRDGLRSFNLTLFPYIPCFPARAGIRDSDLLRIRPHLPPPRLLEVPHLTSSLEFKI